MANNTENQVGLVRDFIYAILGATETSPVQCGEIEHIARCALKGGYEPNLRKFAEALGVFTAGFTWDSEGNVAVDVER